MSESFKVSVTHRGDGADQDPKELLAEAVATCLAASLQFCLRKAHIDADAVSCEVEGVTVRNEDGRLRIKELHVRIDPNIDPADIERSRRCLDLFEDYCTVTASVREGINVMIEIAPAAAREPIVV